NDIEVKLAQPAGIFPDLPRTHRTVINACDRADLRARSAEEHLVGQIEFRTVDLPFLNFHPQLVAQQLNDGPSCNTFQDIVRNRRRAHDAITQHKEVRCRTFETCPSAFSTMASSKPARTASVLIKAELTYAPAIFPRAGMVLSSIRRHEETVTCMFSSFLLY